MGYYFAGELIKNAGFKKTMFRSGVGFEKDCRASLKFINVSSDDGQINLNAYVALPENAGENIALSMFKPTWVDSEISAVRRASELLKVLGLKHVWNKSANTLSGGELKLLESGRALMSGAETILLDEPVGSIDPVLCHQIFSHVLRLRDEIGITFLVIEHRLEVAAQYADHVFAMDRGKLVTEGTAEEVFADERVIKAYLGE